MNIINNKVIINYEKDIDSDTLYKHGANDIITYFC